MTHTETRMPSSGSQANFVLDAAAIGSYFRV